MNETHSTEANDSAGGNRWIKLLVLAVVVGATAGVYLQYRDDLTLDALADRQARFEQFRQLHPWAVYGIAFAVYVGVTGLSLPGATAMTLVLAWLFGFWRALVLVSFASTTGATVAFAVSRYVAQDFVQQRFAERLRTFNQAIEREGAFYLFMLRLIPLVPFFVINAVMGLTPIGMRTFWWVSQLGMLPGTAVYVWVGSAVPDLDQLAEQGAESILSPRLIVAFVVLAVFPLLLKKVVLPWWRNSQAGDTLPDSESQETS